MRVLISGASMAGPSLAFRLARDGHEVTVVERAAEPRGRRTGTVPTTAFAEPGGRDVELERAALVDLLYAATKDDADYSFRDSIATLEQDEGGVDVTFERGRPERYDLVVGADGTHSIVRRLVFGEESRFLRHMGLYVALVSMSPTLGRENWGTMYNAPGRLAGLYRYNGKAAASPRTRRHTAHWWRRHRRACREARACWSRPRPPRSGAATN